MIKLNDIQCILLSHASQRDDGALLPSPDSLVAAPDRVAKTIASLLERGLAVEQEMTVAAPTWREENEQRFAVIITDAGRAAIGVETVSTEGNEPATSQRRADADSPAEPANTKSALVLELLRREGGVSVEELTTVTGWLPHTTRAALTGLRKKGHAIVRDRIDGTTFYAIKLTVAE